MASLTTTTEFEPEVSVSVAIEASPGVDPDETGATYLGVPLEALTEPEEGKKPIAVERRIGSVFVSNPIPGVDAGEITLSTPFIGLPENLTDPASTAVDWAHILWRGSLGTVVNLLKSALTAGEPAAETVIAIASGATRAAGDVMCLSQEGVFRSQWGRVESVATNNVTIAQALEIALSTSASSMGVRGYRWLRRGGPTLSFKLKRQGAGANVTYLMCRASKGPVLTIEPNKQIMVAWTFRYHKSVLGGAGSLGNPVLAPAVPEVMGAVSPVYVDGVSIGHVGKTVIDFGARPAGIMSQHGNEEGWGNDQAGGLDATVTVTPLFDPADQGLVRAADSDSKMLVQLGIGVRDDDGGLSANPLVNSGCVTLDNVGPVAYKKVTVDGVVRGEMQYTARNPGYATGVQYVGVYRA